MPIVKYLVSAGLGAADIALEELDARAGRTEPFRKYSDWFRVGMFALGLFGDIIGLPEDVRDAIMVADIPLLEKTVWNAVRGLMPAGKKASYVVIQEAPKAPPAPTPRASAPARSARATVFSV